MPSPRGSRHRPWRIQGSCETITWPSPLRTTSSSRKSQPNSTARVNAGRLFSGNSPRQPRWPCRSGWRFFWGMQAVSKRAINDAQAVLAFGVIREGFDDLVRQHGGQFVAAFVRDAGDVRCDQHAGVAEQALLCSRFHRGVERAEIRAFEFQYIEPGGDHPPGLDGIEQGPGLDHPSTRRVEEPN